MVSVTIDDSSLSSEDLDQIVLVDNFLNHVLLFSPILSPQSDIKDCSFYWLQSSAMPEVEPFKSVKTKLINILQSDRAEETLSHIEDAVRRTNDIVRHAYQLLDLGAS